MRAIAQRRASAHLSRAPSGATGDGRGADRVVHHAIDSVNLAELGHLDPLASFNLIQIRMFAEYIVKVSSM